MKEKILKCLREAEDYVSGQELCQMFDVIKNSHLESDESTEGRGLCH